MTSPSGFQPDPRDRNAARRERRAWRRSHWGGWGPGRPLGSGANSFTHLAFGIFLTLLGAILTLDRLNLVDASLALRFWPIGFHIFGVSLLMRRPDSHGRFWGVFWLIVGTWLLLNTLGLARISFWDLLWPLVLIVIGVRLILRARQGASVGPTAADGSPAPQDDTAARPNLVAVFGETKNSVHQTFTGGSLTSVMGGCNLDLRQAVVRPGDTPVIEVFSFMGGQEIVLPPGWRVTLDVASIFSGTDDKRLPSVPGGPGEGAGPEIVVRGTAIFSGLTLKS